MLGARTWIEGPLWCFREAVAGSGFAGPAMVGTAVSALGIRALATGTAIPAWQPFWFAGEGATAAIRIDGVALIVLGALMAFGVSRPWVGTFLSTLLLAWIVFLQGPALMHDPESVVGWLGVAEVGAIAAGASLLALSRRTTDSPRHVAATVARCAFGLCAIVFGISHFAYATFTATMVPPWLPCRLLLAYATGLAHVAAGLAIISGVRRRLAASLLTVMMGMFVFLVHVPAAYESNGALPDLTFLFDACALCGSAWIVSSTTPRRQD